MDQSYRITDAADQLLRYGGEPRFKQFYDALEALAELNDDLWHMRDLEVCCQVQADKVKAAVDAIMVLARR